MIPTYTDPNVTLYQADALELLASLEAGSVNLAFLDPPYRMRNDLWWEKQWKTEQDFLDWIGLVCQGVKRTLTPNGSFYLCASPAMAYQVEGVVRECFNVLNVVRWYKEAGWHKKAEVETLRSYLEPWEAVIFAEQWWTDETAQSESGYFTECKALHKQVYASIGRYIQQERERAGLTRNDVEVALGYISGSDPTKGTALCYRWEEGSSLPTAEAYEQLHNLLNLRGNDSGEYLRREYEELRQEYEELRREYETLRRPFALTKDRPSIDLWTYGAVPTGGDHRHETEKPLSMLLDIVETSSRPDDLILDCFLGRGTTMVAAVQLGRQFIGGDIQEQWVKASVARLKEARGEFHLRPKRAQPMKIVKGQLSMFNELG